MPVSANYTISFLRLLRAHQWVKNLFIFIPAFFAKIISASTLPELCLGFISFSLVCSSGYILNDLMDIQYDQFHPEKKKRPISAGVFSRQFARWMALIVLLVGLGLGMFLAPEFVYYELTYFLMVVLYSAFLKQVVFLDVIIIALGFLLRIYSGAEIVDVYVSNWLLSMVVLIALIVGFGKRVSEKKAFIEEGVETRKVIANYARLPLKYIVLLLSVSITVVYVFYSMSANVIARSGTDKLYFTSIFAFAIAFRYNYLMFKGKQTGNPTALVYKDAIILVALVGWIATFVFLMYAN